MNRHARRSDLARYRRETSGALITYMVPPDDAALAQVPLLWRAARWWLDQLSERVRHCIVCNSWIIDRRDCGAVLLSHPDGKPTSASVSGVCAECWQAELPREALEKAALTALAAAVPSARFEGQR